MQPRYIATTAQSDIWSKSDPVLLLGSWCRPGLEKVEPIRYSELPCIWENEHSLRDAEEYCWNTFCRLIQELSISLNRLHGVNHSKRYWEVLLSCWFLHFINVMYDRYLLMKSAARVAKGAWTTTVSRESYIIPPTSFAAVKAYAYDDQQNLQLFSEVSKFIGLSVIEGSLPMRGGQSSRGTRVPLLRRLKGIPPRTLIKPGSYLLHARRLFSSQNGDRILLYTKYLKGLDLLFLGWLSGAATYIPGWSRRFDQWHAPSLEMRKQMSAEPSRYSQMDAFETLILHSAPYFIPTDFIERYPQVVSESQKEFGLPPRHLVFDATVFYEDSAFEEYAARCADSGKYLVSIQHGGAYGHTMSSPAERIEIELCDHFISLGWKDQRYPEKIIPLPSPRLSSLRRRTQPSECILYVSFFGKRYLHRLVTVPHASQWDNYLDYCETLLKSLSPSKLAKIRFRPFFDYPGYRLPPLMASLIQSQQREYRPASVALTDCRIALIDHPSTGWLESLASNTPTVLFWNPAHWRFRPAVEPFLDELHRVGILHLDPVSAAWKVEQVYDRAEEWWADKTIQSVRKAFCERYAWTAPNWRDQWVKVLQELARS